MTWLSSQGLPAIMWATSALTRPARPGTTSSRSAWMALPCPGWTDSTHRYEHGHQGVVSVVEVPATGELVVGVARSSDPVVCEPSFLRVTREGRLPGNMGNPTPQLRRGATDLWTIEYDTIARKSDTTTFLIRSFRWRISRCRSASGLLRDPVGANSGTGRVDDGPPFRTFPGTQSDATT